jgi:hypothetical protein
MAFDLRIALVSSSSCRDCGAGTDAEERSKYQIRKAMISRCSGVDERQTMTWIEPILANITADGGLRPNGRSTIEFKLTLILLKSI